MAEESALAVTLEVFVVLFKIFVEYLKAIFRFFVPQSPKDVTGQVVLITGAGHGMGREVALRFAKLDAVVVCVDINAKGNEETLQMIKKLNRKAYKYECDVTSRAAVMELAEKVTKEVGDVAILINNAGIMPTKPLLRQSEKEITMTYDLNVLGNLWMLQAFLPVMIKNNHGHIASLSSMAGLLGQPNLVPYCGTKFAVRGIIDALNIELHVDPRPTDGIKFTTIFPYMVDTGLCKKPKYRFERMQMVKATDAAEQIVDAILREYNEITIPSYYLYLTRYMVKLMPKKTAPIMHDFVSAIIDPEDS